MNLKKTQLIFLTAFILFMSLIPKESDVKSVFLCETDGFAVNVIQYDQSQVNLGCFATFEQANQTMMSLKGTYPDMVITHQASRSPMKIIAATRAIVATYPMRTGSSLSNDNLIVIFRNATLSGESTYTNAYQDAGYFETVSFNSNTGNGIVRIILSGFEGYTQLIQLDIIPLIYVEQGWPVTVGGRTYLQEFRNVSSLQPTTFIPRMNEYRVGFNSTYNVREIYHETYRFSNGASTGTYTYGMAPTWLADGTYYSWDGITYYRDRAMTMPVFDGAQVGKYYQYYQYLPLRSLTNLTAINLDDYVRAFNYTKKASYVGEPAASSMYGEGNAFINAQVVYGVNGLLVYAMGMHESGRGTSAISIQKNNIFGWGAVDANPFADAHTFSSVAQSVVEHMGRNLRGYLSIENYRFFGSIIGNKNNGFNTKYASDPYWGNKVAGWAYRVDRYFNFVDYNNYTIVMLDQPGAKELKNMPFEGATTMFTLPERSVQSTLLVYQVLSSGWLEIASTVPITSNQEVIRFVNTTSMVVPYDWESSKVYINPQSYTILYDGKSSALVPVILKGDINGDGFIDILDLVLISRYLADLEQFTNTQRLAADVNNDGIIDILDIVRISRILAGLE